jgi:hypothetical protein
MRKALIAGAVATALFAVGAFAASLTVRSEDVASGSNDVVACAAQVDVDFADPVLTPATGVWTVSGATVRFLTAADAVTGTCDAFDARLAVETSPSGDYVQVPGTADVGVPTTGVATFTFTTPIDVATITGASVVVDGATLSADV